MVIVNGVNGDGMRHWCHMIHHHWRQWISINAIFVALGANGANDENSKSFWPIENFLRFPRIICSWSRKILILLITVWSLDPMVVLVWVCLFFIHNGVFLRYDTTIHIDAPISSYSLLTRAVRSIMRNVTWSLISLSLRTLTWNRNQYSSVSVKTLNDNM